MGDVAVAFGIWVGVAGILGLFVGYGIGVLEGTNRERRRQSSSRTPKRGR